ncbi:MAG: HlyU family transcriptional regulator [Pseudomonadota bacterium]
MSLLSRLFGGGQSAPASKPEEYEGFRIYPEPIAEGGKYRLAARIEKEIDGDVKSYQLIRADMLDSRDTAVETAVRKARQVIDEQGDAIFGGR